MSRVFPPELVHLCTTYMIPKELLYVNQQYTQNAKVSIRRSFLQRWFPDDIVNALGGLDKCVHDYLFFTAKTNIIGPRQRLDRLRLCDLPQHSISTFPVYLSVDMHQRPFVVLRYWCQTATHAEPNTDSEDDASELTSLASVRIRRKHTQAPHEVAVTLYQQKPHDPASWRFGTCYGYYRMPGDVVSTDSLNKVKVLVQGEPVYVGDSEWLELRTNPSFKYNVRP